MSYMYLHLRRRLSISWFHSSMCWIGLGNNLITLASIAIYVRKICFVTYMSYMYLHLRRRLSISETLY